MMAIERQHRPIDKEFEECDYTGVLDISRRNLRLFPHIGDDIYETLEVFTAIVSGNRFDKFPKQILSYHHLVKLNFHNNALRTLPGEICKLLQLRHLDVSRNFLQSLPSSVCDMKLESFSVNNNRLQALPIEIGRMKVLKSLDASCNYLTELPQSITDLQSLIYFNIRRNDIRELPSDIFKIPLWYLNVSANMLTRIPISLRHLISLTDFHCEDNPLELPPAQLCLKGLTHIFKYLQEMEKYGSDPQLFATNRDESLMRRRREKIGRRSPRPISDASTLSGSGSDLTENSLLDDMTNFVQNAFGGSDSRLLPRNESELGGGRHWTAQYTYDERNPYRLKVREDYMYKERGIRYRSQSPGPTGMTQSYVNSQSGSHYGTLPRSGKDGEERGRVGGRDLPDEIRPHSGSLSVYHDRRVSSPVYSDRVMRTHSSENTPVRNPSSTNSSQYNHGEDKSMLAKRTELLVTPPQSSSTPQQISQKQYQPPEEVFDEQKMDSDRSNSPTYSHDGSLTPTPEDLDIEEPDTPKSTGEDFTLSNVVKLLDEYDFNFTSKWEELAMALGISLDDRQRVSVQAHLAQDFQSAMMDILDIWITNNRSSATWKSLLLALEECGQSGIANSLKRRLKIDEVDSPDLNKTPQHVSTFGKQVSFSVSVSEIPDRSPSVSSENDETSPETYLRVQSSPGPQTPTSPTPELTEPGSLEYNQEVEEESDESVPSPAPSPSHHAPESPRKAPPKAPKPSNKTRGTESTWPRQRPGASHKRKGDVFKSIGKQDPNFTVRRLEVQMKEELEKVQSIKKEVEVLLKINLSDDLGDNISDGVLLCQLVNQLHPNTISTIHKPRQGETLTVPKKTMNIAAFIAACRKLGVQEAMVCSAGDILEYKDPIRVCSCIRGLLDTVSV